MRWKEEGRRAGEAEWTVACLKGWHRQGFYPGWRIIGSHRRHGSRLGYEVVRGLSSVLVSTTINLLPYALLTLLTILLLYVIAIYASLTMHRPSVLILVPPRSSVSRLHPSMFCILASLCNQPRRICWARVYVCILYEQPL